jgi:hypothetical protein
VRFRAPLKTGTNEIDNDNNDDDHDDTVEDRLEAAVSSVANESLSSANRRTRKGETGVAVGAQTALALVLPTW